MFIQHFDPVLLCVVFGFNQQLKQNHLFPLTSVKFGKFGFDFSIGTSAEVCGCHSKSNLNPIFKDLVTVTDHK